MRIPLDNGLEGVGKDLAVGGRKRGRDARVQDHQAGTLRQESKYLLLIKTGTWEK